MRSFLIFLAGALPALADPAKVEDAEFRKTGDSWSVSVTLSHADTGWDDYADGWRVELEDGTIIGERPLAHPHVNEQPFTRSTSGVRFPGDVTTVFIRARTNTDGWDEKRWSFALPTN